jgi:hypothetical protein
MAPFRAKQLDGPQQKRVFWFFFAKKNRLPSLACTNREKLSLVGKQESFWLLFCKKSLFLRPTRGKTIHAH